MRRAQRYNPAAQQQRVKCDLITSPGKFFRTYKQMVTASGSDNNVCLRHSPEHFPEGNLVHKYILILKSEKK